MTESSTIEKTIIKLKPPSKWAVVIHNDDVTPMDFVVALLMAVFHHDETSAANTMIQVHVEGKGVAGIYSKEVAESKLKEAVTTVRLNNRFLKLSLEKQD